MHTGTVNWFNPNKGFGFITPSDNTKDIFLHISELEKDGIKNITEGQKLSYRIANEKGKDFATDIKLI
jgi:CspA family cold shock protein